MRALVRDITKGQVHLISLALHPCRSHDAVRATRLLAGTELIGVSMRTDCFHAVTVMSSDSLCQAVYTLDSVVASE